MHMQAEGFQKRSRKVRRKMYWRNKKWTAILVCMVLLVIFVLLLGICTLRLSCLCRACRECCWSVSLTLCLSVRYVCCNALDANVSALQVVCFPLRSVRTLGGVGEPVCFVIMVVVVVGTQKEGVSGVSVECR